jgi:hypothetical protein
LKKFGSTAGRVLRGLAILHIRSALDWGRANRPDLPVRVESRVKSSPASAGSFSTGLHVGIADWFGLSREHQQAVVSKSMSRSAHYVDPLCRLSGSPNRARCHPTRCFERPGLACEIRRKLRSLSLERPTPCAWRYANNALEMPREMTLIAEAALRGHIGERQSAIAQLFLG